LLPRSIAAKLVRMTMNRCGLLLAVLALPGLLPAQQPMTVEQVIAKLRQAGNITATPNTVDTIKAGDPQTIVTGIATTISPTMEVLRKAAAAHDNFIITHEPSFYNHPDADTLFRNDPVYQEKMAYIREHHLVLFRFHDGAHAHQPDFVMEGWAHQMGWTTAHREGNGPDLYTSKPITVSALAEQLRKTAGASAVRVIGDPNLVVTKIAYAPGAPGEARQVAVLERDDVEVLVGGEIPEWETISYAWDAAQQGRHKALILMGHYTSEEAGSQEVATWLRTVLPGMKIDFIPAGEPYWLAGHPPARPAATKH
jgi:putative NIF3 family GTP cyclohydrolase 1 type 2